MKFEIIFLDGLTKANKSPLIIDYMNTNSHYFETFGYEKKELFDLDTEIKEELEPVLEVE